RWLKRLVLPMGSLKQSYLLGCWLERTPAVKKAKSVQQAWLSSTTSGGELPIFESMRANDLFKNWAGSLECGCPNETTMSSGGLVRTRPLHMVCQEMNRICQYLSSNAHSRR